MNPQYEFLSINGEESELMRIILHFMGHETITTAITIPCLGSLIMINNQVFVLQCSKTGKEMLNWSVRAYFLMVIESMAKDKKNQKNTVDLS